MSGAQIADTTLREAADLLQQQLVYNGEVLDIALDSLRSYKEGVQSLTYLDSAIHLAYSLLRMLERWGKTQGEKMYVRKKAKRRRKNTSESFSFLQSD
jgi:replication fork protection complex subunit Tof1/Swi1